MTIDAEKLASRIGRTDEEATDEKPDAEADMKPGDHGKRILAAIASKDAEGLEAAIKDCVNDAGGY